MASLSRAVDPPTDITNCNALKALQHTAACCNALQHTATPCLVPVDTAIDTLQHCEILQHSKTLACAGLVPLIRLMHHVNRRIYLEDAHTAACCSVLQIVAANMWIEV